MNKEVADKWVEALPKYKQGKKALHAADGSMCCLGVLCQLAYEEGVIPLPDLLPLGAEQYWFYGAERRSNYLPRDVQRWSGMQSSDGVLQQSRGQSLAEMNDSNYSFEDIAKVIQEKWEEL